jgi:hypothetical protein
MHARGLLTDRRRPNRRSGPWRCPKGRWLDADRSFVYGYTCYVGKQLCQAAALFYPVNPDR